MVPSPDPREFPPDNVITDPMQWSTGSMQASGTRDKLARHLGEIVRYAGGLILEAIAHGFDIYHKPDGSSYTDADVKAERFILDTLSQHFPQIPIIAEEQMSAEAGVGKDEENPSLGNAFFLVDPLDGTRGFCKGSLEYTVNIAAIANGAPIAGAVYAPADGRLWIGGEKAYFTTSTPYTPMPFLSDWYPIHTRHRPMGGMIALVSRRHEDGRANEFLSRLPINKRFTVSSSLKFCLIAQGDADVYPRFGPTMEWDTAAGDAILRAAGGIVVDEEGHPLVYGCRQNNYTNGPFIAWGDVANIPR